MRRFALMNFKITDNVDSKLSYTPCYMQCGNLPLNFDMIDEPFLFYFLWV